MNSIFKKELHDFNLLCEKYFPGTKPISRYMCMDQLDAAIQKKRGAYTEDMTRDWMSILYVCLAAPDCYFFETSRPKKKIIKFIQSQHSFAEALEQERTDERAMYTCIDSVRDFYRNAKSYAARFNSACPPTFKDLKESVYQALKDQIKENPKLRDFEKNYLSTLNRVFLENCKYLKSPIFFLFLPYYLFFELAKCEGLIKGDPDTVNAFGCVSLGDDKPRWSIRNPPFTEGKVDPKQVSSLYQLVESALCEELQKQDHYSVGQELWQTNYESQLDTPNSCCYTEENKQQILARDAIAFSVPFWQYGAWGSIFTNAFFPCDPYEEDRKSVV